MHVTIDDCNCLAIRQAARRVTQYYDQHLAPSGLRTTQFAILAKLAGAGPLSINALAAELTMDRTTLGRNVLPLEREGLVRITASEHDRRSKEVQLSRAGQLRLRAAVGQWAEAQAGFEEAFGRARSAELRLLLRGVVESPLGALAEGAGAE